MTTSSKYSDPEVLAKVAGLSLRAQRVVEGTITGQHRSPYHGFNVEFAEYREYSPGDDLRRLDWRVLARTDRLYVKQFENESNLRATLVLDASASMRYQSGAMSKFDYAATLTASLATLLVLQQDAVGLALFDNKPRRWLPPSTTQAQLVEIVDQLHDAKPDRETDLGGVLRTLSEQVKQRGLIVIISDLLTEPEPFYDGLSRLQYRGHEILVFQILDPDEVELPFRDLVLFQDIEGTEEVFGEPWAFRNAYRAAMQDFIEGVSQHCAARGIDHTLLLTNEDLADGLSHYLHTRLRSQGTAAQVHQRAPSG